MKTQAEADRIVPAGDRARRHRGGLQGAREAGLDRPLREAERRRATRGAGLAVTCLSSRAAAAALEPGEISKPVQTPVRLARDPADRQEGDALRGGEVEDLAAAVGVARRSTTGSVQQAADQGVNVNPKYGTLRHDDARASSPITSTDPSATASPSTVPSRPRPRRERRVRSAGRRLGHVPEGPVPSSQQGQRLLDLVKVMARLRGPGGCPWDAEQTHRTLARHLLEETHELIEAIDADDSDAIRDELGDVLLQVVFHAQIAADEGRWDVDDVAAGPGGQADPPPPPRVRRGRGLRAPTRSSSTGRSSRPRRRAGARASTRTSRPRCRRSRARRRSSDAPPAGASSGGASDAALTRSARRCGELAAATRIAGRTRRRRSATSCSPRWRWRASWAWTPRARCAARSARSPSATSGSRSLAAARGIDVETRARGRASRPLPRGAVG